MPDFADLASDTETLHRQAALSVRPTAATTSVSAYVCEDCGEPIPEARRAAIPGCTRCVACQTEHYGGRP